MIMTERQDQETEYRYQLYRKQPVTRNEICDAIDSFETSNDSRTKENARNIIITGWIQNELRIEKHNPDKKILRTEKEIDDLAMKDLLERNGKLIKVVAEARELYMAHKKFEYFNMDKMTYFGRQL